MPDATRSQPPKRLDERRGVLPLHHDSRHTERASVGWIVRFHRAGLTAPISAHTLRRAFATHILQRGTDIRTIQHLLRHQDLATTMIDTHILQQSGQGVPRPLDDLDS